MEGSLFLVRSISPYALIFMLNKMWLYLRRQTTRQLFDFMPCETNFWLNPCIGAVKGNYEITFEYILMEVHFKQDDDVQILPNAVSFQGVAP